MKPANRIVFFLCLCSFFVKGQDLKLRGTWKFQIGDKTAWSSPSYDDRGWENIFAPAAWEDQGFHGYDGFAWYRKKFDGKLLSKEATYFLNLGFIDDCDEVYLNGKLIGFSGSMPPKFKTAYNNERKYPLSNELINFQGENILAIRIYDVTLGGGIIDGELGIYRSPKSRMLVDLQGMWKLQRVWRSNDRPSEKSEWENILVPSPWEMQGYKYDGNAWYKRSLVVSEQLLKQDEALVLILGKIDDFDRTYLNGKVIGKTNDNRSYGMSHSYKEQRVYDIPAGLLKSGSNVIEVFVEDMGNEGGIYEGPVGITTRSVYQRYYKEEKSFFWENE